MTEKKKWQNPELIVLVRGRPEEAVLTGCKGQVPGYPYNEAGACNLGSAPACDVCEALGVS